MRRRLRLLLVPLLAVAFPLLALAAIGYEWLTLDREAAARRSQDAAELEASNLRAALLTRMGEAAAEVDRDWLAADEAHPFVVRPRPHPLIAEAYRFTPDGQLDEPDYDAAYQRTVRAGVLVAGGSAAPNAAIAGGALRDTRLAHSLLDSGRRALGSARPAAAVVSAERLLDCCAATRDEFGVSLAVLGARQLAAAWRREGVLEARLPGLISRLTGLVDGGAIGHPDDMIDVTGLLRAIGDPSAGQPLLVRTRASADAVTRIMNTSRRLTVWLAAAGPTSAAGPVFQAAPINIEGRDVIGGRFTRPAGGQLIVLFDTAALASALAGGQRGGALEGSLVTSASALGDRPAALVPLLADLPGVQIAVRARPGDVITQRTRTVLFGSALLAALALTLVVAYFGFRDVAREVSLAGQQSNFVASVSHELKTPVASIRLLAETLRMKSSSGAPDTVPLLDEILEQADRQSRLIDNVLSIARIDRGLPMHNPANVDFAKVVEQALDRLNYVLRQEGFTVHRTAPVQPLLVSVDPEGLLQAITNLVTNAVKYSGRCREISITLDRRGPDAELQVVDRGIGIDSREQRKIFERFYRTAAAAGETGGTGLGLALVRHFAEVHGGRVAVDSAPGRGSTFTLRLPALSESAADERSHA